MSNGNNFTTVTFRLPTSTAPVFRHKVDLNFDRTLPFPPASGLRISMVGPRFAFLLPHIEKCPQAPQPAAPTPPPVV